MKSPTLQHYLHLLDQQRLDLYQQLESLPTTAIWERPIPEKWSIGEHLVHLQKALIWFSRGIRLGVLFGRPYAYLKRKQPFETETKDVYTILTNKGKKLTSPLPARPKAKSQQKAIPWLQLQKDWLKERNVLVKAIRGLNEETAGHIRLWHPLLADANLMQMLGLMQLHEQHHFKTIQQLSIGLKNSGKSIT